jgi:cobalt-zinc-cadmium efflux system membrane fusion protein
MALIKRKSSMKNKYLILAAIFVTMVIGGRMVFATNQGDNKILDRPTEQKLDHPDDDDHDEDKHDGDHDAHDEELAGEDHDEDGHDEDSHEEESDLVKMTKAQQEEIGLVVAIAHSGDIKQILSLVGEVRLHEDRLAHLVPKVSGIVSNVQVSLGEEVKEGQILATIDSPELAELQTDYLEKIRTLELSRRTFERKQYLKQENIASEADWLEAQSALQNGETMLRSAKRRLVFLGISENEINALGAADDEAFGSYAIKSPITGTIIAKHITRGEKIGEEEVFTVADLSVVWVDLQIPAQDLGRVEEGLYIEITSTEGNIAEEKLALVGPVVDKESRTVLGRVVLPNPEGLWKPGIFVKGQIHSETTSVAVLVPSEAVQNIDGENIIFAPEGDGFEPKTVTLGRSIDGKIEIMAGLAAGDRYVAKGAFALKAVIVTSGAGGHAGHGH